MKQLAICGESLSWFAIIILITTAVLTGFYIKTNNEYRIMKAQTKDFDYEKKVFKLWLPFCCFALVMIALCVLPFLLIEKPIYP
jgi:NADH:ubiquinone oxidoreductase subunit 2 (subunit N)